jgi:hypothetical protein
MFVLRPYRTSPPRLAEIAEAIAWKRLRARQTARLVLTAAFLPSNIVVLAVALGEHPHVAVLFLVSYTGAMLSAILWAWSSRCPVCKRMFAFPTLRCRCTWCRSSRPEPWRSYLNE